MRQLLQKRGLGDLQKLKDIEKHGKKYTRESGDVLHVINKVFILKAENARRILQINIMLKIWSMQALNYGKMKTESFQFRRFF